jgi:hypothetical protein
MTQTVDPSPDTTLTERTIAETLKLMAEQAKLNAEEYKLRQEAYKLLAEQYKLDAEGKLMRWQRLMLPVVQIITLGAALIGAIGGITAILRH